MASVRSLRQQVMVLLKSSYCSQTLSAVSARAAPVASSFPHLCSRHYHCNGHLLADSESKDIKSMEDHSQEQPQTSHLEYDLDKLLENIRAAQRNTELTDEVADVEGDRSSPMSIEELVDFLRGERGEEVAVIRVPPEREYVNYFVTCMGLGGRHIQRMADNLAAEVKKVRDEQGQKCPVVVEGRESDDWVVVHLGDTVVHLMTQEARQLYQLEQLWTLGHRYDDQYQRMEKINLESDALR